MSQMLIRAPEELKSRITSEAKRIGISTNALLLQILWNWLKEKNREGTELLAEEGR